MPRKKPSATGVDNCAEDALSSPETGPVYVIKINGVARGNKLTEGAHGGEARRGTAGIYMSSRGENAGSSWGRVKDYPRKIIPNH